jgi:hypothetical protein
LYRFQILVVSCFLVACKGSLHTRVADIHSKRTQKGEEREEKREGKRYRGKGLRRNLVIDSNPLPFLIAYLR